MGGKDGSPQICWEAFAVSGQELVVIWIEVIP